MKRIVSVLVSVCLACLLLAACGGGSASYNVADVAAAVSEACAIDNPKDFDEDTLVYELGINAEDIQEFAGQRTLTNGQPGTALVIHTAEGKAADVQAALESYRDGVLQVNENYQSDFPVGYENTANARIVVKGDYVVYAVAGEGASYDDVDAAIDEALS